MSIKSLSLEEKRDLVAKQLDDGIWFRRSINAALHCPGATLLFSQLYWIQSKRDQRLNAAAKPFNDGWVWKTREEWCAETTLTEHELRTARRVLREAGLLEEREERLKHRIQYRLIPETTFDYLLLSAPPSPMWENTHTPEEEELEQAFFETDPLWKPPVPTGKTSKKHLVESTTTPCGNRPSYLLQKNTANTIPAMPECSSSEIPDSSVPPTPTPLSVDLPPTTSAAAPPFDLEAYLETMINPSKPKHLRLMGHFIKQTELPMKTAEAIQSFINRYAAVSSKICNKEGWTDDEIMTALMDMVNSEFWQQQNWNLDTLHRQIPIILRRLNMPKKK